MATSIHRPLVQDDAFERIEFAFPRFLLQHRPGVFEAGLPAMPDSGPAEIDILGVVVVPSRGAIK